MKMRINQIAKLTGVSVRTLHYYDEIGLLKPSFVDEQNGYRFYNEDSLERLREILFYRELDFSLKEISEIISLPGYDKAKAFYEQKRLLTLKKERLERLINVLGSLSKGEGTMNFSSFDNSEFSNAQKKYAEEAKRKWGMTEAGSEFERKTANYSAEKWTKITDGMNLLLKEFADCANNGEDCTGSTAQSLVKRWQDYITNNYYTCTKEILAGLGCMYSEDERFAENIDRFGKGTANFMSSAIRYFCEI